MIIIIIMFYIKREIAVIPAEKLMDVTRSVKHSKTNMYLDNQLIIIIFYLI